jgi:hypothetical protein
LDALAAAVEVDEAAASFEFLDLLCPDWDDVLTVLQSATTEMVRGTVVGALSASLALGGARCGIDKATTASLAARAVIDELAVELENLERSGADPDACWIMAFEFLCPLGCAATEIERLLEHSPCDLATGFLLGLLTVRMATESAMELRGSLN